MMNAKNINSIPLCTMMVIMYSHLFCLNALIAKYSDPRYEIFSIDLNYGFFGFLNPDIALFTLIPFGILCSLMGSAGYILSLLYFSPEVVSNCFLLEPFVAQIMGYYCGFDELPGVLTVLGTIVTLIGVFLIDEAGK